MPVSLIPLLASLGELLDENSFSLGELHSHPLAAIFAPQFDDFQTKWFAANAARTALTIALGKAIDGLSATDDGIDDLLDFLDRTLLIITKNDRSAPQYVFYFGPMPVLKLGKSALPSGILDTAAISSAALLRATTTRYR